MHGRGILEFFVIIGWLGLLFDWAVFSGLSTLSAKWKSRRLRQIVRWGYLVISIGITVTFFVMAASFRTARGMTPFHEWVLSLFLTLFVTRLIFSVVLFLGDLGRVIFGLGRRVITKDDRKPLIPSRRKFISEAAVLLAAVPFTGFLYAMIKGKYDYRVHRATLTFPDLPEAFDGFTITQLSDIHSGSFDNTSAVQRGVDLAKEQRSDLFVFTGDLVNNAAWEIEPYLHRFGAIKAPMGQYSILGNHDYGEYIEWASDEERENNLETLKQHHREMGYRLMLNEHIVLEKDGQKIVLLGVENWGKGFIQKGDLDKALAGVDPAAFKICFSHDPSHWEEIIKHHPANVHLTLSGHTHGAQFGVESDKFRWSPVQYRYKDWAGLANEGGRYLYVNRGFGFLAFSGRLGIWPEVTVLTLKRG